MTVMFPLQTGEKDNDKNTHIDVYPYDKSMSSHISPCIDISVHRVICGIFFVIKLSRSAFQLILVSSFGTGYQLLICSVKYGITQDDVHSHSSGNVIAIKKYKMSKEKRYKISLLLIRHRD